jgi:hypothetical protein
VLLDAPAGEGDSQDAELEAVRMQTLLDYCEHEARQEEVGRREAQALKVTQSNADGPPARRQTCWISPR